MKLFWTYVESDIYITGTPKYREDREFLFDINFLRADLHSSEKILW